MIVTVLYLLHVFYLQLRYDNEEVTEFNQELRDIVKQMFLVMYAAGGIGLAAPQVGINKRLMIFNEKGSSKYRSHEYAIVNPRITSYSTLLNNQEEGCLSFPDLYGTVRRPISILVEYQTIAGEPVSRRYEGYLARIFQHEYDHLDKVTSTRSLFFIHIYIYLYSYSLIYCMMILLSNLYAVYLQGFVH